MVYKHKNKQKKLKKDAYINDLNEWQEHQYSPGYFLGGKIPPYLKYSRNNRFAAGYILLVIGLVPLLITVIITVFKGSFQWSNLYTIIFSFFICTIGFLNIKSKNN